MDPVSQYYLFRFDETYEPYKAVLTVTSLKEASERYYETYRRRMLRSLSYISAHTPTYPDSIIQLRFNLFQYYIKRLQSKLESLHHYQIEYNNHES
jgi:hypothetical protein